ncbi:MAG: nitrous oxide-stimulated promoter family protein [Dehalococcoidia bacterium]|nr:MAG: nitrous oxide-stimulated promoter family protein [Dehalococcoidia bacterium]
MSRKNPRLYREGKTVEVMITVYCRKHHSAAILCPQCEELLKYAHKMLDRCPFGEGKTTCIKCPVHCYKPQARQKIRTVMRYSGPRMIYIHPLMAIRHIVDGRRKKPITNKRK